MSVQETNNISKEVQGNKPFDELSCLLLLHLCHLCLNILGGHFASENCCSGQISSTGSITEGGLVKKKKGGGGDI